MHLRNKSCECFVCFFRSRGRHDVWDSYCADKQLQIYLASQLVGGWVVKTRRGGQIEAIQAGGGEEALWSHFVPIDAFDGQKKSFTSGHENSAF